MTEHPGHRFNPQVGPNTNCRAKGPNPDRGWDSNGESGGLFGVHVPDVG